MHLLNTLPQRLDPGATPTFAGLIASSLTSPAGNNLTLGLGTGGTALTLTSSTLAATFAGVVVVTDGSAAAPSLVVSSSPTTGFYRHGSGAIGFSSAGLASAAFSSNSGGGGLYLEALGTNQNIRVVPSGTGVFTTASPVTFTNSTAGAASAGALVVTGGLSAGNNGNASYFGGAVTAAGAGKYFNTFNTASGGYATGFSAGGNAGGATTRGVSLAFIDGTAYHNWADYSSYLTLGVGTTEFGIMSTAANGLTPDADGTMLFKIQRATGAATFAGAVSITGNVGFYGQAATAKPTGVAVTAAAIHAALVTLNLIAA
jgi:hypothetical protein